MALKKLAFIFLAVIISGCAASDKDSLTPDENRQNPGQTASEPDFYNYQVAEVLSPNALTLSQLQAKYKTHFMFNSPEKQRQIALTFDDGPDLKYTPQILNILRKHHVKATFFLTGSHAKAHPNMVKRIVKEGHVIGNHSYNHPNLLELSDPVFQEEINKTNKILQTITGRSPRLMRPPYGFINEQQLQWLIGQEFKIINWNVDSFDWKVNSSEEVKKNILDHVTPGSIILQHSTNSETVDALPTIIKTLRAKKMRFVTVPELLNIPAYHQ